MNEKKGEETSSKRGRIIISIDENGTCNGVFSEPEKKYTFAQTMNALELAKKNLLERRI